MRAILLSMVLLLATSCQTKETNVVSPEDLWMKKMEPIISALYWYYAQHNTYPASLDALVPDYLYEFPYPAEEKSRVQYHLLRDSYDLSFVLVDPEYRECHISPSSGADGWRCYAYR